ncbi:MAG TPA: hypothetical protein ENH85_02555 [Candidatus Scalindua sp.]|nr:hypothetical protein [Candidatus Scalindua sp.]
MKTAELIQELEKHILTLNLKSDRASIRLIRRSIKKLSEYTSQQPTLSQESVMEVLKGESITIDFIPGKPNSRNSVVLTEDKFTKVIDNLTPAVSDDKLLELLLSENGLEDDRIAKLFKDSRDAEYKAILEALHEAWEEIKQLQSTKMILKEVLNGSKSEQPDVNNEMEIMKSAWPPRDIVEKLTIAADVLLHKKDYDGHGWEGIEYCWRLAKEWLQSIQPAKGEECECKDLNATNRICNHCGKIVPIIHYQNPPTPDEKGGCKHNPQQNDKLQIICTKCGEILHR